MAAGDTNFIFECWKYLSRVSEEEILSALEDKIRIPKRPCLFCRYWWNSYTPRSHSVNEISKEPAARPSGKLSCNWLIMLVTMATPISSHVKYKNSIFTARDEDMIFLVKGKILVFHQYLYNKNCLIFEKHVFRMGLRLHYGQFIMNLTTRNT